MATQQTAAYNFTVDDASPLIRYEPANFWDDNVVADVNLPNYFQQSYHYSINPTATATLNFTGTGAWVLGGRRSISGTYSVQIDDQPAQTFGANSRGVTQYQVILGGVNGLPFGEHTIVVKNLSTDVRQQVLDIDSFLVETSAGNESGQSFSGPTVIDDANPGITYSANGWVTTSRVAPSSTPWSSGTVHESNVNGANAEFTFEGQGVSVVGAVGPRNGRFRVEVDGRDMGELNAKAAILHPATPIWFANNLSPGQHRVKLTNTGSNGDALSIDSYQVFASTSVNAPPPGASASGSPGNSISIPPGAAGSASLLTPAFPTPSVNADNISYSRTSSPPLGLIIGSSIGGLAFLCLIALGIMLYARMRRKNAALSPENVRPFTQAPPGSAGAQPLTEETRWSTATAVDVEAGLQAAEKGERTERAERVERAEKSEKSSGWLRRTGKDKNGEPSTPPLPLQDYTPSPSTPRPPGPNPILGTGGYTASSAMSGPSGSRPSPAPTPSSTQLAELPIIPALSIASPGPPPRTPLPPTPIIGMPPRGRQQGSLKHTRTPSAGTGLGRPSGSRPLTSQEVRRSRSAQVMREQAADDALLPPPSGRFNQPQARESHRSLEFDLSAYTDPRTPTSVNGGRTIPAMPSISREYAPYASRSGSIRSSLDSEQSGGAGQRRRAGMI